MQQIGGGILFNYFAGNRTNHFEFDKETAYQSGYPKNGWLENDRLIIDKNNLIRKRQLQILECCKDCSCAKNVAQEQIFNTRKFIRKDFDLPDHKRFNFDPGYTSIIWLKQCI